MSLWQRRFGHTVDARGEKLYTNELPNEIAGFVSPSFPANHDGVYVMEQNVNGEVRVYSQRIVERVAEPDLRFHLRPTDENVYTVRFGVDGKRTCTCPDVRERDCKHILAVHLKYPPEPPDSSDSDSDEEDDTQQSDASLVEAATLATTIISTMTNNKNRAVLMNFANRTFLDLTTTKTKKNVCIAALSTAIFRQRSGNNKGWTNNQLNQLVGVVPGSIIANLQYEWYILLWGGSELTDLIGNFMTTTQLKPKCVQPFIPAAANKRDLCVAIVRTAAQRSTILPGDVLLGLNKLVTKAVTDGIGDKEKAQWERACRQTAAL